MYQSEVTLGLNEERWVCLFVNPVLISNARLIIRTNNHTFTYTSSGSFTPLAGSVTVLQKALNQPLDLSDFSVRGHSYLKRRIACWGDSFTSANYEEKATYCKHLQNLLGEEWEVLNGGISGNRTDEIATRQGGLPLVTGSAFTIPAGSGTIRIDGLLKTHGIMGEPNLYHIRTFGGALANPCKVVGTHGEEVLCTINSYRSVSGTDTTYYANLTYSKVSTPIEIAEHTPVQTYAARELKDVDLTIIYMGTNGSFGSNSDNNRYVYSRWDNLAAQHQEMIDFVDNSDDYIVLGRHDALSWDNMGYSTYMESVFGNRYLNLRTPVVGNEAVVKSWLMYSGLYGDESEIPQEEVDRSVLGYWPRPLQHAPNDVHPNDYGAKVIAKIVYDRMVDLHYLDY